MTELLASPPSSEKDLYAEWEMEVRHGGFETEEQLLLDISQRIEVLYEDEEAPDNSEVVEFRYKEDEFDTHVEIEDEYGGREYEEASLAEFINDEDDISSDRHRRRGEILKTVASEYFAGQGYQDAWWHNLSAIEERFPSGYFEDNSPTEQFIIGQHERGVRFFNYGDKMPDESVETLEQTLNVFTQYFGDRTYDFLQDVVIAPFENTNDEDDHHSHEDHTQGFAHPSLKGALFLHDSILSDSRRLAQVFAHEFGHLLHGSGEEENQEVLEFAKAVGWDVEALEGIPNWHQTDKVLSEYAPNDDYVVHHEDGTEERVSITDYYDKYGEDYDEEGNVIPGKPYHKLGSPTGYGDRHPHETSAETTSAVMTDEYFAQDMPEARDAWLEHMQNRILLPGETPEDRPLATPINHAPMLVERRTDDAIVFPSTKLPDVIYIRPVLEGE